MREALEEAPAPQGGQAMLDRLLAPRLRSCRGRPRSAFAASPVADGAASRPLLQIALPSARCSPCSRSIDTVTKTTDQVWNQTRFDVELIMRRHAFDARAAGLITSTAGVAQAQPEPDELD